jgi:hypothetical protein
MMSTEIKDAEDMKKLPVSKRAIFSEQLGVQTGKMLNAAVKKANKLLNPFGFKVEIEVHYKELPKEN